MDDELVSAVLARASGDGGLGEDAKLLVLEALDVLDVLGGEPARRGIPARAYLSSLTVQGYRGVGPRRVLGFTPGPGLVIVSGRNGSGKSSFAEALEVALTGRSYRWDQKVAFRPQWRNLHHEAGTSIVVDLVEEGRGRRSVGAEWPADADLEGIRCWVQPAGQKREPGLGSLGWDDDMRLFRPFLAYDELESMLTQGRELHAALDSILGLQRLDTALDHLDRRHKDLAAARTSADRLKPGLRDQLGGSDDYRARQALDELRPYGRPDLDLIASLVTGDLSDDGGAVALRQVAELEVRPVPVFADAVERVAEARAALAEARHEADASAHRRLEILRAAVDLHHQHGDGACPVCGEGALDAAWSKRVRAELAEHDRLDAGAREARENLDQAWRTLLAMVTPPPGPLLRAGADGLSGAAEVAGLWQRWDDLGRDELLVDGVTLLEEIQQRIGEVRATAKQAADARQNAWRPLALALGEWLRHAQSAADVEDVRKPVKEALDWLKNHAGDLRNDRVRPLADRARHVWSMLRQESNVDLGEITLTGRGKRGAVALTASVDGQAAGAMQVMSQGEVNALALSLFIPKASLTASPFGFMVIDDPVQAMDPAKVDGLAQVLEEFARDRQVVVFTHDDRLSEAVRRLRIDARLVEITRDADSVVSVSESQDPALRHLRDARAVARDSDMPGSVQRYVVPELCRLGLEARCRDVYFARQLTQGVPRREVEGAWGAAQTTRSKLAMALYGRRDAGLQDWERQGRAKERGLAIKICASDPHTGTAVEPAHAVDIVQQLIRDLPGALPGAR